MLPTIVDTGCSWVTPLYLTDQDISLLDARTKKALLMHNETVEKNCWSSKAGKLPIPPGGEGRESRYRNAGYQNLVDAEQKDVY